MDRGMASPQRLSPAPAWAAAAALRVREKSAQRLLAAKQQMRAEDREFSWHGPGRFSNAKRNITPGMYPFGPLATWTTYGCPVPALLGGILTRDPRTHGLPA